MYLRARYYEPGTMQFLQQDTVLGNIQDPLSRNLYAYGQGNPVMYVDPSGHVAQEPRIIVDDSYGNVYYDPVTKKLDFGVPVIQKGDTGEKVVNIQSRLISLKHTRYDLPKYGADGDFGDETLKAVNNFKKDKGINNEGVWKGIVDPTTKNKLVYESNKMFDDGSGDFIKAQNDSNVVQSPPVVNIESNKSSFEYGIVSPYGYSSRVTPSVRTPGLLGAQTAYREQVSQMTPEELKEHQEMLAKMDKVYGSVFLNLVLGDIYDAELILIGYDFEEGRFITTRERGMYLALSIAPGSSKYLGEAGEEVVEAVASDVYAYQQYKKILMHDDILSNSDRIINGADLWDQKAVNILTNDGSNINDWWKMESRYSYSTEFGEGKIHYYQNIRTGKISSFDSKLKVPKPKNLRKDAKDLFWIIDLDENFIPVKTR